MGATLLDRPSTALIEADIAGAGDTRYARIFTPMPGWLFALTMSTAGASTTMTVSSGSAADTSGVRLMKLSTPMAKTTSAWAVGTAAGGLDTGAIAASTWYHFFLIQRVDTGVVDVLFSLSATAPTMPANYTLFRRIGSMLTNGSSQWTSFTQLGDEFLWGTLANQFTDTNPGTAAVTKTLTVPTGIQVQAILDACAYNGGGITNSILFTALDQADTAPVNGSICTFNGAGAALAGGSGRIFIRTNTSGQIRYRCPVSDANQRVIGMTVGWIDTRGKLG